MQQCQTRCPCLLPQTLPTPRSPTRGCRTPLLSCQSLVAVPAPRTCQGCRWLTLCFAHGSPNLLQLRRSGRPTIHALMTHRCVGVRALMSPTHNNQRTYAWVCKCWCCTNSRQGTMWQCNMGAHGVACFERVLRMPTVAHTIVQPSRRCSIPPKVVDLALTETMRATAPAGVCCDPCPQGPGRGTHTWPTR
jgi:hypothetical protein